MPLYDVVKAPVDAPPLNSLNECPFCGSRIRLITSDNSSFINVVCDAGSSCHGSGLYICIAKTQFQEAVKTWQKRKDPYKVFVWLSFVLAAVLFWLTTGGNL